MSGPGLLANVDARGVMTITLDRPERRNAFDESMAIALGDACAAIGDDVRLLVLRGTGSYFCAGFDLLSRTTLSPEHGMAMMAETYRRLSQTPVPTLAVVPGGAAGGGLGLVACCDIAIAETGARFASPEGRHGILPAVILPHLAQAIGSRRAAAMALTGLPLDAADALALGLLNAVADLAALDAEAERWVEAALSVAPTVSRAVKPYLGRIAQRRGGAELAAYSARAAVEGRSGPEAREGARAFRERRLPSWVAACHTLARK